jgi:Ca2+-binding RTX toxin-like protein
VLRPPAQILFTAEGIRAEASLQRIVTIAVSSNFNPGSGELTTGDNLDKTTRNDQLLGEAGNDRIIWNPGDGSDLAEGGDGIDQLDFKGTNVSENVTISGNGGRLTPARDVGNITMHFNGVEGIKLEAWGADSITIKGIRGTDLKRAVRER